MAYPSPQVGGLVPPPPMMPIQGPAGMMEMHAAAAPPFVPGLTEISPSLLIDALLKGKTETAHDDDPHGTDHLFDEFGALSFAKVTSYAGRLFAAIGERDPSMLRYVLRLGRQIAKSLAGNGQMDKDAMRAVPSATWPGEYMEEEPAVVTLPDPSPYAPVLRS